MQHDTTRLVTAWALAICLVILVVAQAAATLAGHTDGARDLMNLALVILAALVPSPIGLGRR